MNRLENVESFIINSRTSGAFETVQISNRDHLKTKMVPIVGDSVMNNILYPLGEVEAIVENLNLLTVTAGHPRINGIPADPLHPVAINIHNIGGFVMNARMENKKVVCDFLLDIEVAAKTENGAEVMRRIENSEAIGVSIGGKGKLVREAGVSDGKQYSFKAHTFRFNHIATCLDGEQAGGVDTVILNSEGAEVDLNNLTASALHDMLSEALTVKRPVDDDGWLWVQDIVLDTAMVVFEEMRGGVSKTFMVSFTTDGESVTIGEDFTEVTRKVEFVEKETQMANEKTVTVDEATDLLNAKGFVVVGKEYKEQVDDFKANAEGFATYLENKADFEAFQTAEGVRLENKRKELVEASGLTADKVSGMDEETIDTLLENKTGTDNRLRGGSEGGGSDDVTAGELGDIVDGKGEAK